MKDIKGLIRRNIRQLQPYSTARDDFKGGDISVWLDANESPYGRKTTQGGYSVEVNRYPDPHQRLLKERVARLKGVKPDNIFIGGSGSDEAIDLVYRIFCEPRVDNVVAIAPSYGVYSVAAEINDVEYRQVRLNDDYSLDTDRLLAVADSHTKVIWICSPNNPTGNAFDREQIADITRRFDGIVVVDEAYVDFSAKGSMLEMLDDYPNLIVMQTFSKAWGMASLRLGMAFASPLIAGYFAMVKYPYNVNGMTQEEVLRQIDRDIAAEVAELIASRDALAAAMAALPYVRKIHPSDANFLLAEVDEPKRLYDYLIDNKVIVRDRSRVAGCEGCLRITVGTLAETRSLIEILNRYV